MDLLVCLLYHSVFCHSLLPILVDHHLAHPDLIPESYRDTEAALARCGVDATIVLVDNDGGGIFHMLPIADHETFEPQFKTPHGLDFEPTGELYGLDFERVADRDAFVDAFERSVGSDGTQVLSVAFDAEASHTRRERLRQRVADGL